MPRISSEKAVEMIGNRYDLVLIASARARELAQGHRPKVQTEFRSALTALTEIEEGKVGRDYLNNFRKKQTKYE